MDYRVLPVRALQGSIDPPGDKSISHRAIIFNSIAYGASSIENYLDGADTLATVECLKALGVQIRFGRTHPGETGLRLTVDARGLEDLVEARGVLDAKNSGTTMRLLAGLLASLPFSTVLSGDCSLNKRPMDRVIKPLREMGAGISGHDNTSFAPLTINGGLLHGIEYKMPVASAQVKSALLLAGLSADGPTVLHQPSATRDHTERMLKAMGAAISSDGNTVSINPGPLSALDIHVPGDVSSAAPWLVAASIHPHARICLRRVGVNPTRIGVIKVLQAMGARISVGNREEKVGEPVADITVESSHLQAIDIGGDIIPNLIDEIPLLALAATQAVGETVIRDAAELRVKESDRIHKTVQELNLLGADIEERSDGMVVRGPVSLTGGQCNSHGDHRLAMTLGVAGLLAQTDTFVKDAGCVDVSYPGFWKDMAGLRVA